MKRNVRSCGDAERLPGFEISSGGCDFRLADGLGKTVKQDDECRLIPSVGPAEVEVKEKLAGRRLLGAGGIFAEEDKWAFFLPQKHGIRRQAGELGGFTDKQGLPVKPVCQGIYFGEDFALQIVARAVTLLGKDNRVSRR